jgi:hypothetical protein
MANKLHINGKTYRVGKGNVTIRGTEILVDGIPLDTSAHKDEPTINITLENCKVDIVGEAETINITGGKIGKVTSVNGDVNVLGNIDGDVSTINGNVKAHIVQGDVTTTNGSIHGAKKE